MKKREKRKKKKVVLYIIILCVLLLIVAGWLFLFQEGYLNFNKEIKSFEIRDECTLMFNSLLHPIKDEGSCKIRCIEECKLRTLEYQEIKFIEKQDSCNTCTCSCA